MNHKNGEESEIPWATITGGLIMIVISLVCYVFISNITRIDAKDASQDQEYADLQRLVSDNSTQISLILQIMKPNLSISKTQPLSNAAGLK